MSAGKQEKVGNTDNLRDLEEAERITLISILARLDLGQNAFALLSLLKVKASNVRDAV